MGRELWRQVAEQVSKGEGVGRTIAKNLATKQFYDGNRKMIAIEQNPDTGSEWASLARRGHKVVQIKDADTNEYVGVVVDGKVRKY